MSTASCPNCGGPVEFAIGSSAAVICAYCNSVVARTDRGVETHGQVAALIDTGTPLRVGLAGKYNRTGYRITGRSQLRHQAGGVWDEWYAAFDDGRWGWLAEAQGRFYVTFKDQGHAPAFESLDLGQTIDGLTVSEIGKAELISAEGELPWRPEPGYSYSYADLTGREGGFATIDYSETPPLVFRGREVSLSDLGLEEIAIRQRERVRTTALNCTRCGGPLNLVAPDQAERIWCPNCGSGHDVTAGKLSFFATLKKKKVRPVIALGSRGTIDGAEYVVAGFMERAVRFDRDYFWTEYLLYNRERGYRWLVSSDDHWSFVTPLRAGEVAESYALGGGVGKAVHYEGRRYRLFQDATARVTYVLGEFYWKVEVGEAVDTADYIAPPFGISKEVTRSGAREVNYSHARYMDVREVEKTFGVELARPSTIGPMQPFPGPHLGVPFVLLLLALLVTAMVLGVTRPGRTLLERTFDLAAMPAQETPNQLFFTEPVQVSGDGNILIEGSANVDNEWLYVEGDFVNAATNALIEFSMPIEYYHGVDQGERWSEGKRFRRIFLSAPEKGSYVLRVAAQWEQGKSPRNLTLRVREGVFRWPHFLFAFFLLTLPPFFAFVRRAHWESERWKDSAHSPYAQLQELSGDDDEEE